MKFQVLVKRRIDRGLEGSSWDPRFKQNTVRDSGNVKRDTGFDQNTERDTGNVKRDTDLTKIQCGIGNINVISDLTASRKTGFTKTWAEGSRIGKENDIRDSNKGSSRRGISVRTERSGTDAG